MPLAIGLWDAFGGLLGLFWLICLLSAGVLTWRNGHKVMFFIGFLIPIVWIVGAAYRKSTPYQPGIGASR